MPVCCGSVMGTPAKGLKVDIYMCLYKYLSTLQLGVQAGIEEEEGLKGDTNEYNEEANDNKDSLNFLLPIGV